MNTLFSGRAGVVTGFILMLLGASGSASDFTGTARVGWIIIDDEGNRAVDHSTYNIYEGGTFSLEKFRYLMDNGLRVYGDFSNITLNNRNLVLGVAKSGHGQVSVSHNKYRRVYSFDGDRATRREQTRTSFWWQAHKYVRLFGGIGRTVKTGLFVDVFEPAGSPGIGRVDYGQTLYHGGAVATYNRSTVKVEFRGSTFSDELNSRNDRTTRRYRLTAASPLPNHENLLLNAGLQRYEASISDRYDSLIANTFWFGGRYYYRGGYSLRYSFIWDRARRTGDISATDNLAHTFFASKTWRGIGGVEAGYRYQINDDVADDLRSDGYSISGWFRPLSPLTVRAGYGIFNTDVESGRTLTGDRDRTHHWASVRYRHELGTARVKIEQRDSENDEIGSSADYLRFSGDLSVEVPKYGQLIATYAYSDGEWENSAGAFEYGEHVFSGDFLSREYSDAQAGVGGLYTRSRKDLDIERFSVRFFGGYRFADVYRLEARYTAYNYDDFNDVNGLYTQYYTSNVIEFSLTRSL
jgi:hypothetical protein